MQLANIFVLNLNFMPTLHVIFSKYFLIFCIVHVVMPKFICNISNDWFWLFTSF